MEPIGKFRLSKLFIVPHSWLLNHFDSRKKSIILVEKILSKEPMCRNISFEIIHAKNVLWYNKNQSKKFCVHFFKCRNFSVVIFPSFFCRKKSIENEKAPVEKIPSKFLRFPMEQIIMSSQKNVREYITGFRGATCLDKKLDT